MNHYARALAELQLQPDHELKQIGDQWQTPTPLAWGLFHHFAPTLGPVVLDMFADDCNHLLPNYYTAADNALTQELAADLRRIGGAAFGNPPYSRPCVDGDGHPITGMEAILHFCREQRALGAKIMLLIKAATSEAWWPEDADFIQFISGRIGFDAPSWYVPRDPKKDKPSASGFASAVVIFDASWQGERRPEARLRRDDLVTTGTIILDMIHRQASELAMATQRKAPAPTEPAVMQDQPAIAKPLDTNAAVAAELSALEGQPSIVTEQLPTYPDYAAPGLYLTTYANEVDGLTDADRQTLNGYLKNWLAEGELPSEICYRLVLAATNLKAGQQAHVGFVQQGRAPALPHWQRHPAVKGIIYQIDDADILTPAKTAELAAWIIDNLTASGDLLELATTKAAELLAQSAEPQRAEQQLDMLDGAAAQECIDKPLADWAFDYQNDQLNLGETPWRTFVAVLTTLYGVRPVYTPREVAIAISVSDETLMDEYTTLPESDKQRLRHCVSTLRTLETGLTLNDTQRQRAVLALCEALTTRGMTMDRHQRVLVMREAILPHNSEEQAA
ncbi:phage N-6-adenine-methyltransferase [Aeromonas diversa]|uniref:phage N-6-adenine-methyltransferase n=1 Tax=Aeromonas diversa TaxID=502790 RepID=UPI0034634635